MNTKRTTLVLAALLWAAAATLAVNEARADIAYTWGDNQYGELGDGTQTNRSTPAPVTGLTSGVTAVAAGEDYSLAVRLFVLLVQLSTPGHGIVRGGAIHGQAPWPG